MAATCSAASAQLQQLLREVVSSDVAFRQLLELAAGRQIDGFLHHSPTYGRDEVVGILMSRLVAPPVHGAVPAGRPADALPDAWIVCGWDPQRVGLLPYVRALVSHLLSAELHEELEGQLGPERAGESAQVCHANPEPGSSAASAGPPQPPWNSQPAPPGEPAVARFSDGVADHRGRDAEATQTGPSEPETWRRISACLRELRDRSDRRTDSVQADERLLSILLTGTDEAGAGRRDLPAQAARAIEVYFADRLAEPRPVDALRSLFTWDPAAGSLWGHSAEVRAAFDEMVDLALAEGPDLAGFVARRDPLAAEFFDRGPYSSFYRDAQAWERHWQTPVGPHALATPYRSDFHALNLRLGRTEVPAEPSAALAGQLREMAHAVIDQEVPGSASGDAVGRIEHLHRLVAAWDPARRRAQDALPELGIIMAPALSHCSPVRAVAAAPPLDLVMAEQYVEELLAGALSRTAVPPWLKTFFPFSPQGFAGAARMEERPLSAPDRSDYLLLAHLAGETPDRAAVATPAALSAELQRLAGRFLAVVEEPEFGALGLRQAAAKWQPLEDGLFPEFLRDHIARSLETQRRDFQLEARIRALLPERLPGLEQARIDLAL